MKEFFKFDFSNLRGDFLGGLTAGIVALPLALAFGDQTALGAMAGLYGAIAIAILAALFGGTATQVSGPTAPMTVVSAAVIASSITESGAETIGEAMPIIIATFFLAGLIEMIFGIIKLGKYIRYIPYPVVSGFMSGIGIIIIITQLFPLLGYNPSVDTEMVQQRLPHAEEQILENILREEERTGLITGTLSEEDLRNTLRDFQQVTQVEIQAEAQKMTRREISGSVGTIKNLTRPFAFEGGVNYPNLILAILTILIIYGFKRIKAISKVLPSSLVALVLMTGVAFFFFRGQVPVIGDVESGLPALQLGFFPAYFNSGMLGTIVEFAFTLAALGAIDSLLTSVVADNLTKTKHDSNQELIGQGIGNMGAALIGGLPGAGATMRTVINANSGGKTKLSGIFAGVFLLAVLLGLGPIVAYIPKGVLAGILFTVGIGIIDYKAFRHIRAMPRSEVVIMLAVLFLTVFVNLLLAVGVGMILAALLFMIKTSDLIEASTSIDSTNLTKFAQEKPWVDEDDFIEKYGSQVFIKHLSGPVFFGFSSGFAQLTRQADLKIVIIRFSRVQYLDQSGLYAAEDAITDLQNRGIAVLFTGLDGQPRDMLRRINILPGLVPKDHCFASFEACRAWLRTYLSGQQEISDILAKQREVRPVDLAELDEV